MKFGVVRFPGSCDDVDALCASDEREPPVQAHPGHFEGRQAQRSGELERAVAEQRIRDVLTLSELRLLAGRLCAEAEH